MIEPMEKIYEGDCAGCRRPVSSCHCPECSTCGAQGCPGCPPVVKDSLTAAPACRRCAKSAKLWKGWELCGACGHRHHVETGWHDPIPPQASPGSKGDPMPMVLHCPECRTRHIDAGEFATKPHHTHACQGCGMVWRPAIGPTVGVQFLPGFKNEEAAPSQAVAQEPPTAPAQGVRGCWAFFYTTPDAPPYPMYWGTRKPNKKSREGGEWVRMVEAPGAAPTTEKAGEA